MSSSGDVIEVNMQVGMQYEHAGGHMQDNHNTVFSVYTVMMSAIQKTESMQCRT